MGDAVAKRVTRVLPTGMARLMDLNAFRQRAEVVAAAGARQKSKRSWKPGGALTAGTETEDCPGRPPESLPLARSNINATQQIQPRSSAILLTHAFKETVLARVQADPKFRNALLKEGIETMLARNVDNGKAILRDYVKATVGFEQLGAGLTLHVTARLQ
jgi:hypothetical protein